MKEDKNLDRLFQESFKDFEVSPPDSAWETIEKRLNSKSKKRVIPLWRRLTAAVAILALLILAGSQWYISPPADINNVTETTSNSILDENALPEEIDDQIPSSNQSIVASPSIKNQNIEAENAKESPDNNTIINPSNKPSGYSSGLTTSSASAENGTIAMANKDLRLAESKSQEAATNSISNFENNLSSLFVSPRIIKPQQNIKATFKDNENTIEQLYASQSLIEIAKQKALEEDNTTKVEKPKINQPWFIKPQLSPVFYGNIASGSAIDENFSQNSSQGEVDLSYGLNVGYQLSEKVKIRTGVNRVNLSYTTNDLFLLPNTDISSIANVVSSDQVIASVVTENQLDGFVDEGLFGRQEAVASDLRQNIGFIEFPLEMEYKLVDRKIAINLIGGASTFLLNNNSIDVINSQGTITLGEASNINTLSFSTNFALGFDYSLSERMFINLEPTFKYQINTFQSGTTDFQPFILGVYTGFIFKF